MEYPDKCNRCKYATYNEELPCEVSCDIFDIGPCEGYYPLFESSADTLKNLPIISIRQFKKIAPSISRRIDVSKIKTVEDIYDQRDAFYGAMWDIFPNLLYLSNHIERIAFWAWYIVEDENRHHCIISH